MNEWRSLRELLEQNSPAVIASAIERHGVFVYDRYNRVVKASPESKDDYSQAKALDLIADWQAELSDPGPTYSWGGPCPQRQTGMQDAWRAKYRPKNGSWSATLR